MAVLYPDIKTKNWQISTVGAGYIAEGLADIRQCLDLLLRTQRGSDPLRPDFGCDIYQYMGIPVTVAIPNIKRAIIDAILIWEKRVVLKSIRHEVDVSHVKFYITVSLADEELIDLILYYQNGSFSMVPVDTQLLVIYGLFPPNPNNKRYHIYFDGNDEAMLPLAPSNGFATTNELYNWVVANWSGYGSWSLAPDRIIGYLNNGMFESAFLTISLVGTLRFEAPIPQLAVGEDYALLFTPNGSAAVPAPANPFTNIASMLAWVQANWGAYGLWSVETNVYGPGDFDILDFDSEDFDVGAPADYLLVLQTETVNTCTLQVNIV